MPAAMYPIYISRLKVRTEESDESEEESALLLQRKWEVKRQLHRASPVKSTSPTNKVGEWAMQRVRAIPLALCCVVHASWFAQLLFPFPLDLLSSAPSFSAVYLFLEQIARRNLEDLRRIRLTFAEKSNEHV